jgi:hypothetical protein
MAIGTYAALNDNKVVFDIVEMDILSELPIPAPYSQATYVRVGEPTPTPIPTIGQVWNGEIFE